MACQIFNEGKSNQQVIALNQKDSKLFKDLKKQTGDNSTAVYLYKLAHSKEFQEQYGHWELASKITNKEAIPESYREFSEYEKSQFATVYKTSSSLISKINQNYILDENGEPNVDPIFEFDQRIGRQLNQNAQVNRVRHDNQRAPIEKAADFISKKRENLLLQASRFKGTESDYTSRINELLKQFDEVDTTEALYLYEDYIHDLLGKPSKTGKMMGIEGRLNSLESINFENMEYAEFTKKSMEAKRALHEVSIILNSLKDLNTLDSKDYKGTPIQAAVKNLKRETSRVYDLDQRYKSLAKSLYRQVIVNYGLTSNPDILQGDLDLFDAQFDETAMQRWMDSPADTGNSFIANTVKLIQIQNEKKITEERKLVRQFTKRIDDYKNKGYKIEELFEVYNGNKTGKLVREYDWRVYGNLKTEMHQLRRELQEKIDKSQDEFEIKKLKKQQKRITAKFFTENQVQRENYTELVKEARERYGADTARYRNWYWTNHYQSDATGVVFAKGELIRPADKYESKAYKEIASNPEKLKMLDYLTDLFSELVSHTQGTLMEEGYLPPVPLDQRKYWEVIRDIFYKKKETPGEVDGMLEVITDENGRLVHFVPFHYMRLLDQLETVKITEEMTDEEEKAARAENRKRYQENRTRHAEALDYNIESTVPLFIKTALNHKYKKEIEGQALLALEILKGGEIKKNRSGKELVNKILRKKGETAPVTTSAEGSNIVNHYEDWLRMVFYEEFANPEKLEAFANSIQNYVSFKGIGFNYLSALNNLTLGTIMQNIEAAGGIHYGIKNWAFAQKIYNTNVSRFVVGRNKLDSGHVSEAIIKEFDILQSQDELMGKQGGPEKTILHKLKFMSDLAYSMQHLGEHMMQNKALLAMTNKFRVTLQGRIVRDPRALARKDGNLKEYNTNLDVQEAYIDKFNSLGTLYDNYELDSDGFAKEKIKISTEEKSLFKQEVVGVNQANHGIYNKEDAGAMQQYALGRLGIQFRKWMMPGWNKRFGSRFFDKQWNERRNIHDEGMYVSTLNFLGEYIKGLKDLNFNYKLHMNNMDEQQQANVRKTFTEFAYLIGSALFMMLLTAMAEDDEELKENTVFNVALYQLDRLTTELQVYNVYGFINEGRKILRSPMASSTVFEDLIGLGTSLFWEATGNEDKMYFQGGARYGDRKSTRYLSKMIPFLNQANRLSDLEDNNKYYKLY